MGHLNFFQYKINKYNIKKNENFRLDNFMRLISICSKRSSINSCRSSKTKKSRSSVHETCEKAGFRMVAPKWDSADKEAGLTPAQVDQIIEDMKQKNKDLYKDLPESRLIDLEELATKFDDKLVEKFKKITVIKKSKQ